MRKYWTSILRNKTVRKRETEHIDGSEDNDNDHRVPEKEHNEHHIRGQRPIIPRTGVDKDVYNESMAAAQICGKSVSNPSSQEEATIR